MVSAAATQGLSAWLLDAIGSGSAGFADEVITQLTADARKSVVAAARTRRTTLAQLDLFAEHQIPVVLLKGYGLAARIYPSGMLRTSSDVDVLVRRSDLQRVRGALLSRAFVEENDAGFDSVEDEHHHISFQRAGDLVEVHFMLFRGFGAAAFDDEGLWRRMQTSVLDGRRVSFLGPEDEFLYLAVHAANHGFLRVQWLLDLCLFVRAHPTLDWGQMVTRARRAGLLRPFQASVVAAQVLLGVDLGPRNQVQTPLHRRLAYAWLMAQPVVASGLAGRDALPGTLFRFLLSDGPRRRFRLLLDGTRRYVARSQDRR